MTNLQLYLAVGLPMLTNFCVVLVGILLNNRAIDQLRTEVGSQIGQLRTEMVSLRDSIHRDMVRIHERIAVVETKQERS